MAECAPYLRENRSTRAVMGEVCADAVIPMTQNARIAKILFIGFMF